MSFIDSFFANNVTVTASFQDRTESQNASGETVQGSWTETVSKDSIFWKGSGAAKLADEQHKSEVQAVLFLKNLTSVTKNQRVAVESQNYYVSYVDNIAYQGKVFLVFLKGYES